VLVVVAAVEEWAIVIQGGGPVPHGNVNPEGNVTPEGGPVKAAEFVVEAVELELENAEVVVGLGVVLGAMLAVVVSVLMLDAGTGVVKADDSLLF